MINTLFRGLLVATYLLALVSLFVVLPQDAAPMMQRLALVLLGVHALECLLAYKHIKRYTGPLWVSLALSLLFGLLHWMPLARAARQAESDPSHP
jgi:uncharacterized protein YhhL (DUF1145 family)